MHIVESKQENGIVYWTCTGCNLDVRYDEESGKTMYYNMGEQGIQHFNKHEVKERVPEAFSDFLRTLE